jgi:hypothetical protein
MAGAMLGPWSSFYVMIGSSAAALTGLMFVVITLVNNERRVRRNPDGIATFSTPTVLHFCAALFVAAVFTAPWRSLGYVAGLIAAFGTYGAIYLFYVVYRTSRLQNYKADVEDWTWFSILPLLTYLTLVGGAIALLWKPAQALFFVAGATILLIFIGIRNSWDVVTFLAAGNLSDDDDAG